MTLEELYASLPPMFHSRINVVYPFVFYDDGAERYVALLAQNGQLVPFDRKTRLALEALKR